MVTEQSVVLGTIRSVAEPAVLPDVHMEQMLSCGTESVAQTKALGAAVAELVAAGDVLLLTGDLGAGKTAFVQGFAAALGVTTPVTSPTFTLANVYEGIMLVNHLDVYRFERTEEVRDLALPELLDNGVTLVEWGDLIAAELGGDRLAVRISFGVDDNSRRFELEPRGDSWQRRARRLAAALRPWQR